jgi:low affinity Fe/Cu permease
MANQPRRITFSDIARRASDALGTHWAFMLAVVSVVVWAVTGPVFNYSETWQLVINTATTIVTFLMVFLVQNTQNRDARAMHLKLDEIIRSVAEARDEVIDIENCTDDEISEVASEFESLSEQSKLQKRG